MIKATLVNHFQGIERLFKIAPHLLFDQFASLLHHIAQRLAVNEVHHVVGGAVLVEQVAHLHDVLVLQFTQSLGLGFELLHLFLENGHLRDVA